MSIRLMTVVWRMDLPPAEKLVLLALADNASDEGNCFPSIATIVKKTSLSEPTVHRCIKKLADVGYIVCHYRQGRSTYYSILATGSHVDTPPQADTNPPSQRYPTPPQGDTPPPLTMTPTPPHGDTHNHQVTIKETSEESSSTPKPPRKRAAKVHNPQFDEIRLAYPKRGGSQNWHDAAKAYNARLGEGYTHEQMLAGCERYSKYLSITGKEGTEFVKTASAFFGPNKSFLEPWTAPAQVKDIRQMSAVERVRLACNTARGNYDERVVSEQSGSIFGSLDVLVRDVRK